MTWIRALIFLKTSKTDVLYWRVLQWPFEVKVYCWIYEHPLKIKCMWPITQLSPAQGQKYRAQMRIDLTKKSLLVEFAKHFTRRNNRPLSVYLSVIQSKNFDYYFCLKFSYYIYSSYVVGRGWIDKRTGRSQFDSLEVVNSILVSGCEEIQGEKKFILKNWRYGFLNSIFIRSGSYWNKNNIPLSFRGKLSKASRKLKKDV